MSRPGPLSARHCRSQRPPLPQPALQGAPNAIVGDRPWMRALKVAQQGDRRQRAGLLQQGKKIVFPMAFKGIAPTLRPRCAHGAPTLRPCVILRFEGGVRSASKRRAVRSLNPARAAAVPWL